MSIQHIIIQIGAQAVSAGFAGHPSPFYTSPSTSFNIDKNAKHGPVLYDFAMSNSNNADLTELEFLMEEAIYDVLVNGLLVDPKRCKLYFIESLFLPIPFKRILNRVCLYNLHCISVIFMPQDIMTCVAGGSNSGIVVNLGWWRSEVVGVFDLRVLYKQANETIRGGSLIHELVRRKFQEYNNTINDGISKDDDEVSAPEIPLSFDFVENFIKTQCYCRSDRTVKKGGFLTFQDVKIPEKFQYEAIEQILLGELDAVTDNENLTIVNILQTLIGGLPIDLKKTLPRRIIFTGGMSMIPGVTSTIIDKLENLVDVPIESIFSLGPWKGASLYLSSSSHLQSSKKLGEVSREKYLSGDDVLIDWSDALYS